MIPRFLSSLQHPLVKRLVKIRDSRAFREQENAVLIAGKQLIEEVRAHVQIKTLISTQPLPITAETSLLAKEEVIQKIVGHTTDDLVVAEVKPPPPSNLDKANCLVVLDQISDPGNVGAIFRTVIALGWDGVFLIDGSADPYNDKALRASRGSPLKLPWRTGSWKEVETLFSNHQIVVADLHGTPVSQMRFSQPLLLVLGHETRGPSDEARRLGKTVTIPMKGPMESLNVASAAAILLYHIQEELNLPFLQRNNP